MSEYKSYEIESLKNKIELLESRLEYYLERYSEKIIREQKNGFPFSFLILFTLWVQFIFTIITAIANKS